MFPNLRLPMTGGLWSSGLGPQEAEAWLQQEEARMAAQLEAIRSRVPQGQPIGIDSKAQSEEQKEDEEEDQDMDEEEEETEDDAPADRF
mmetsp:Transcript_75453/g.191515  ORF Transcript_75453/g.191515 Transcript_75453/m.191515 type:complete len:89 (+) Transcript_75453:87-353(+)